MNLLDSIGNKFFYHLIGPLQPYFKRRLQEAQVKVKEGTIQDIAFSPEALNKNLTNSPVIVDSFWIARCLFASYEPLQVELHSPILCLRLNPDYAPSQSESTLSMTELAKSSIQVAEEVMKESVAAYLDDSKSPGSELLRRVINVLLHRVSVVVKGLVVALEVPNKKTGRIDILRFRIEQLRISDSSQITSYKQALNLSYSSMAHLSEKKTAEVTSFSIELFSIDPSEKTDMLHLVRPEPGTVPTALSIPGTTKAHVELSPQPFSLNCNVELQNVHIGLQSDQIAILGSITHELNSVLSRPPLSSSAEHRLSRDQKVKHADTPPPIKQDTKISSPSPSAPVPRTATNSVPVPLVPHAPSPSPTTPASAPGKVMFQALEDDDDDDDENFEDAESESETPPTTPPLQDSQVEQKRVPSLNDPYMPEEQENPEMKAKPPVSPPMPSPSPSQQGLHVIVNVGISFLQMALMPTRAEEQRGKKQVFSLATLEDPSKMGKSYLYLRVKDLLISSTQSPIVGSSLQATLAAMAVHERYKLPHSEIVALKQEELIGEVDHDDYLTYQVMRIHHPHGHSKAKADPSKDKDASGDDSWALRFRYSVERRVPLTQVEVDQITLTLPGGLPKLLSQVLDDFGEAFPSEKSGEASLPPKAMSGSDGAQPSGALSPTGKLGTTSALTERKRMVGLVDSSSSSEVDINSSTASLPHFASDAYFPSDAHPEDHDDVEAPPPSQLTVKVNHLLIALRFPDKKRDSQKTSSANLPKNGNASDNYPRYLGDFVGIHFSQASLVKYTQSQADLASAMSDSVEFATLSLYLLKGNYDITELSRMSRRRSGSSTLSSAPLPAASAVKRFLHITANASDMTTETVTIQRRHRPAHMPQQDSMTVVTEYRRLDESYAGPSPSAHASALNGNALGQTASGPRFVNKNWENAPFSSTAARFENEIQVPSAMDDALFESFRSSVISSSELAVAVTIHELELTLEKKEADHLQALFDTLSSGPSEANAAGQSSAPSAVQVPRHPFTGIMSGFALDVRVNFATFQLTTNGSEYRFSNVESLRFFYVSKYLQEAKTFLVLQVGSLRLPCADALPNAPPTISKIPEFSVYDSTNVLTVILSTEQSSDSGMPRTTILVETNRMAVENRLGEKWISELSGFFVRDTPVDLTAPKSEMLLFVNAKNSSVVIRGNISTSKEAHLNDPQLLIHLEKLTVSSRFVLPLDPSVNNAFQFKIRSSMAQLFLIDDKGRVWLKPFENGAHIKTMRQYWLARGYSPAGFIEYLFANITLNSQTLPKFSAALDLNAKLDTTGDQVYILTQFLASIASPSPESLASSAQANPANALPQPLPLEEEEEPEEIVAAPSDDASDGPEQYVLVQMSPELMKQQALLGTFKMARKPPTNPIVTWTDAAIQGKMPKLIENYRPVPVAAPPPTYTFQFTLTSTQFTWYLREGVSLSDERKEGFHEFRDILSTQPSKHVAVNLKGLKLTFTSDESDQTDLDLRVSRIFFTTSGDLPGALPFVDLDRAAFSTAPNMISLQLTALRDLQEDSPGLHKSRKQLKRAEQGPLSSILVFSLLPLAIRVDVDALDFLRSFYNTFAATKPPPTSTIVHISSKPQEKVHFHRVSVSAISLNLNVSAWAVRMEDAVIRLPSLYSRNVEGWEGVSAELSAVYSPLLYSALFTFAGSLPVVRLALSVLGSVSNLVINPYSEYQQGRSAAAGAYGALTVGATSVASELLKFGAWITSSAGDGLQYLESFWHAPDASRTSAPGSVRQGAQLGYANMARQVAAAKDCLVVLPWKEYKRSQSVLGLVAGVAGAVPLAILKPVIGVTHGLSNVMQGASNAIHVPGRTTDFVPAAGATTPAPSTSPSVRK